MVFLNTNIYNLVLNRFIYNVFLEKILYMRSNGLIVILSFFK